MSKEHLTCSDWAKVLIPVSARTSLRRRGRSTPFCLPAASCAHTLRRGSGSTQMGRWQNDQARSGYAGGYLPKLKLEPIGG